MEDLNQINLAKSYGFYLPRYNSAADIKNNIISSKAARISVVEAKPLKTKFTKISNNMLENMGFLLRTPRAYEGNTLSSYLKKKNMMARKKTQIKKVK